MRSRRSPGVPLHLHWKCFVDENGNRQRAAGEVVGSVKGDVPHISHFEMWDCSHAVWINAAWINAAWINEVWINEARPLIGVQDHFP